MAAAVAVGTGVGPARVAGMSAAAAVAVGMMAAAERMARRRVLVVSELAETAAVGGWVHEAPKEEVWEVRQRIEVV